MGLPRALVGSESETEGDPVWPVYLLGGFAIRSEIPLDGAAPLRETAGAAVDVVIRRGAVPESLPGGGGFKSNLQTDGRNALVYMRKVARYHVRDGREIIVDPVPGADDDAVRVFLLGKVLGVVCHMRGVMPFHACVIALKDGCAAFAGPSRAGKSTLAAALAARGYPVLADDVCFTRRTAEGDVMVSPGIRRMRLWSKAAEALGYDCTRLPREVRAYSKYLIPVPKPPEPERTFPLRRFYSLVKADADTAAEIERLRSGSVIEELVSNVYRIKLAEHLGRKAEVFSVCAGIAQRVPVFRLRRAKRFESLPALLDQLEQHMRDGV